VPLTADDIDALYRSHARAMVTFFARRTLDPDSGLSILAADPTGRCGPFWPSALRRTIRAAVAGTSQRRSSPRRRPIRTAGCHTG
jgi:hypothetical protein